MNNVKSTPINRQDAADLLTGLKESILADWETLACENVKAAQAQSKVELRDSLPKFLDRLIETLAGSAVEKEAKKNCAVAKEHGAHRARQPDYSLDEVIFEYHILRSCIIQSIARACEPSEEVRSIIHEFLDEGIRMAVGEYVAREKFEASAQRSQTENIQHQLADAIEVAKVGFYDWDMVNDHLSFSEKMRTDWGIDANAPLSEVIESIHPDDRVRVMNLITQAVESKTPYATQYRIVKPGGRIVHIEAKGKVSYDQHGNPLKFMGTSIDITEQVNARNAVEMEKKKFEAILGNTPGASAIMRGKNLVFEAVNLDYQAMFANKELIGLPVFEVFPEGRDQGFAELIQRVIETGVTYYGRDVPFESIFIDAKGKETKYFDIVYVRIEDPDGKPYGIYNNLIDVTSRVAARHLSDKASELIQRSQADLVDTLESMRDAFFSVDENWIITQVNTEFLKITRRTSPDDLIGKNLLETFLSRPEDQQTASWINYHKAMREKVPVRFIDKYDRLNLWSLIKAFPKASGGLAVFVIDVSETKKAEDALAHERQKLDSMIDLSPTGIALMRGRDLIFERVNDRFTQLVGPRDYVGRAWTDVYSELQDSPLVTIMETVFETGVAYKADEMPIRVETAPGKFEDRFYDFSYIRICDGDGVPYGICLQCSDVTIRVEAKHRLAEASELLSSAKDEAERANVLKSAFLANMSHEIRTPLGAILGFNDLLRDPGITASERANFQNIIARNGTQLSVIIDDILDLSKVEAGHLTLEYTKVDHKKIGADVMSLMQVKAREKDLAFEYSSDPTTPESIVSDPTRVRQILLNLASNAIKFTKFGSVHIRTYGCRTESGHPALCFEVTDTGIGLSEAQQKRLFQTFTQADETTTRKFGGTGLGLALSRRLARELGGDITISRSEENKGTTFLVKIADRPEKFGAFVDRPKTPVIAEPALNARPLEGLHILVVDDAPDNQQLIWRYLTKAGATVESAENGQSGYRTALAGRFDLVLMDIQMPVMDGYTATAKLRESGYTAPIIALTAHAMSDIRKKALNVGYTDHLTKPIDPRALVQTIYRLTRQTVGSNGA